MKKITLFLLLILTASFSFAQVVVLEEDFETGVTVPPGWFNNDIAVAGDSWLITTGGAATLAGDGNTLVYTAGGAVGSYATFDSDATSDNGAAENVAMESPTFSCAALTQVTLEYNHLFAGNFGGVGFVEVSADAGANWTTISTYDADGYAGGLISTDVTTELAGVTDAQVRFRWTGDFSVAWYVDNVRVYECAVSAPLAAINPTPNDGDLMVPIIPDGLDLLVDPFAWEEDPLGDPAETYTLSLGITAAGDDIGTIAVTNGNGIIYTWAENTQYWWFVTGTNCGGTTQSPIFTFTTAACNETAAPACTNLLSPLPNEDDVATAEAANLSREVNLSWDPIAGALAYSLTFDGNNLGNVTETDIDIFGLDYDTSYTWSIAPVNCFGATTGCETRTFTTEQDPNLSVAQFENKSLSVFPNPVKDQLTISTELSIESVVIYNILGKQVKSISGNSILNNKIDMTSLGDGMYFLNITAEGKKQTIKIIKE